MATLTSVMQDLKAKGSEKTRATYVRNGIPAERAVGVSVADLKVVAKGLKGQQELAMELAATGMMEAIYLAGMVAKGALMTRAQLDAWAKVAAGMSMVAEHTVPWVTVENAAARELAVEWMGSSELAPSGWCTYSGMVATMADEALDLQEIERLLELVVKGIDGAENRERYTMNGFVISVGTYVRPLLGAAKAAAKTLGNVSVDVGKTACEVPVAEGYIAKVEGMGRVGLKRKTIRC
jgi:hypothetical protein